MGRIHALPKEIAQLIAAGEVVERPASVVKELLENAIDAGATEITLEIQHGGIRYIRITDNGFGIAREDVPVAFLSHATSKIQKADDLDAIFTLGFRGEALASIAAVSKVEIMTKTPEEFAGTRMVLEGGDPVSLDDAGCPVGTTIIIRDLFYNTPARMKFLKSDRSEGSAVAAVADHLALSHPEVSVRFIKDGKEQMMTPGNGDLLSCIHAVYGKDFAETLLPANGAAGGITVRGFVSKPYCARGTNTMQHFFVNNRYIKTRSGAAALTEAYKNSMMVGRYPACVLFMEVQPALVDVNVHPAKTEVRFSDERKVFDAIYYAAKNAIAADKTRPMVALHTPTADRSVLRPPQPQAEQLRMPVTPATPAQTEKTSSSAAPKHDFSTTTYSAPNAAQSKTPQTSQNANPTPAQLHAYETLLRDSAEAAYGEDSDLPDLSVRTAGLSEPTKAPEVPVTQTKAEPAMEITQNPEANAPKKDIEFRLIGEAFKAYIFVECEGKLLIIDKHAAHERMLYNALKKGNGKLGAQMLLAPVTVTLSKEEYAVLTEHMDVLRDAGFEAEDFGEGAVLVRACPLNLETEDITALITEIAGYLLKNRREVLSEKLDWVYHSIACRAAIKAGMDTTEYELRDFTAKLLAQDDIRYCPHGRPVLIELSKNELDKQFGRIQ